MTLAEIKAAAEAATRRPYPYFEQVHELRAHRAWLVERCEELEEGLRRQAWYGEPLCWCESPKSAPSAPTDPDHEHDNSCLAARAALARLEGDPLEGEAMANAEELAVKYEAHLRYIRDMAKSLRDRSDPSKVGNQWLIDGITFVLGEDVAEWQPVEEPA